MKTLIPLILAALTPSLAHAAVDFKCESLNPRDPLGGWVSFGSNGKNGHLIAEYWNGYPPIGLVDADLDNGTSLENGEVRYVSEPDRRANLIGTLEMPPESYKAESFRTEFELRGPSPDTKGPKVMKYELKCVRH